MKNNTIFGKYFCGNKISEYGLKNGRVDYATLAKSFDAVLNNDLMNELESKGFYFEIENGFCDHSEKIDEINEKISAILDGFCKIYTESGIIYKDENGNEIEAEKAEKIESELSELEDEKEELENDSPYNSEIYQFYIISSAGVKILSDYTDEIIFYCEELDLYIWGVTHYGTAWDYVLTDIPCEIDENAKA